VTTQIERAICADPELAQWDGRMGQAFKRKYSQLGGEQRRALLTDQRQWIALRNGQCDVATFYLTAEQCILQLTKARIATLEDNTGWKAVAAGSANTPNAQGPVSVSKIAQAETSSPKVSFLKGECKVELDAADLGCDGSAFHTKLDNGRNLVSFPTRDIATIGFAGNAAVRTGENSSVLWVDRVYVNQNIQDADGQCSLEYGKDEKSAKLECRAVMRDGRKILGELGTQDGTRSFLEAPAQVVAEIPQSSSSNCPKIIQTHGFLVRAESQCGFGNSSIVMFQAAKNCAQQLPKATVLKLISSGAETFDRNEKGRGRATVCADVLQQFSNFVEPRKAVPKPNEVVGTEQIIQGKCQGEWPDDFSMRAFCEKQQRAAVLTLSAGKPQDIPQDMFLTVRRKCTGEWPNDFIMRAFCEKQQFVGIRELGK
jgi:hypothetical protein